MFLALEFSAAAKSPLRAEIQTALSSLPPFSEEQLLLLGQDSRRSNGWRRWKQGLQRTFILAFFTASSLPASPSRWQQLASGASGSPTLEQALLMSRHSPGTDSGSLKHSDQDSWR